uniref:Uncharacterized protein n=1 Tax=Arundo donax TaxID=35708 RepID=A0A0A9FZV9_ARUDO
MINQRASVSFLKLISKILGQMMNQTTNISKQQFWQHFFYNSAIFGLIIFTFLLLELIFLVH